MLMMVALAVAGFVAAFTTATIGVGGGMLVMPVLALLFPPRMVVVASAPMFLANAMVTFLLYRKNFRSKRLWIVLPGVIVGILLGTVVVQTAPSGVLRWVVASVALIFLGISVMMKPSSKEKSIQLPLWTGGPISILAGVVSTLSNTGGTLLSIYLLDRDTDPERFVGGMTFLYVIMTSLKTGLFQMTGLLTMKYWIWSLPSLGSIVLGGVTGKLVNKRIPLQHFRWAIIGVVGISCLMLFVRN